MGEALQKVPPPEEIYNQGLLLYSKKKYSKALEKFELLKKRYPLNRFTILADLKIGDIHFARKEYLEAISAYEEFVKLRPRDEMAPYALFRLGECYRVQVKSPERDLTYLKKAKEYYTKILERFPRSEYAGEARKRLHYIKEFMARHELVVGMFYYRLRKYRAALGRFRGIVENYSDTAAYYKALYYMGMCYMYLGEREASERAFLTLLEGFQGGEYSLKAMKILEREFGYSREAFRPVVRMEVKGEEFFKEEKGKEKVKMVKKIEKAKRPTGKRRKKKTRVRKRGPVTIEAKKVESYRAKNMVVFTGDVIVRQGDLFLYASRVEAYLGKGGKGIKRLRALGNVRIIQGERFGRCEEADYYSGEGIIVLKGNPQVWYGESTIAGDRIVIDLTKNTAEVESRERVKAVIYPEEVEAR